MCRYGIKDYNMPYACFDCRKSFKRPRFVSYPHEGGIVCPDCKKPAVFMGHDFKPPKQQNRNQWRKVELLYEHDYTYNSCGCTGPGYRPHTLAQAKEFVK